MTVAVAVMTWIWIGKGRKRKVEQKLHPFVFYDAESEMAAREAAEQLAADEAGPDWEVGMSVAIAVDDRLVLEKSAIRVLGTAVSEPLEPIRLEVVDEGVERITEELVAKGGE